MDVIEKFRARMAREGIVSDEQIIPDGELHRFHVKGDKPGIKDGFYVLHYINEIYTGMFGWWRHNGGEHINWCSKRKEEMSPEEDAIFLDQINKSKRLHEEEKKKRQSEAREASKRIWNKSKPAPNDHPYLVKKGVRALGLRVSFDGKLIVPLYGADKQLHTLQFISVEGEKRFLSGGMISGNYYPIGKVKNPTDKIYIGEGYATCMAIYEATGCAVACAFNCGNLLPVARAIKAKLIEAEIIIIADNDQWPNENGIVDNTGLKKAEEAAKAIGATVKYPDFSHCDVSSKPTDWNDLKQIKDIAEVKRQLDQFSIELWDEPENIQVELVSVEPLKPELIPEPFRDFIVDVSNRMQCPIDFVAAALLTVSSILIGTGCSIKPKCNDNWLVVPNLWGCAVGRPGMLKSPAVGEPIEFLNKMQTESKELYDKVIEDYKRELKIYNVRKNVLEKELEKALQCDMGVKNVKASLSVDQIKELLAKLKEPTKPIWRRYKTNDCTIEKMTILAAENPIGILVFRDELIGLLRAFDKIGHETDRAFYLESWSGLGSFTADRVTRETSHAENLCISIFGTTQPDKLLTYLESIMKGDNDGFLQRFQLFVYPDEPVWELIDTKPNFEAKKRVQAILKNLGHMNFESRGARKEDEDRFPYFTFSEDAQKIYNVWITELEHKLRSQDIHPLLIEHFSKYRSLMPSLALIFHLLDLASNEDVNEAMSTISERNALLACAWCDYLESHARRIYGLILNPDMRASELAKKIKQGKLKNGFTWRDVNRKQWRHLNKHSYFKEACEELIDKNWIKKTKTSHGSDSYLINPKIKMRVAHD